MSHGGLLRESLLGVGVVVLYSSGCECLAEDFLWLLLVMLCPADTINEHLLLVVRLQIDGVPSGKVLVLLGNFFDHILSYL